MVDLVVRFVDVRKEKQDCDRIESVVKGLV